MNGYESYFHKSQNPKFARYYIDYGLLKDKIRHFYNRRRQMSKILRERHGSKISSQEFYQLARDPANTTANNGGGGNHTTGGHSCLPQYNTPIANVGGHDTYFLYKDDNHNKINERLNRKEAMLQLSYMERRELSTLLAEQWNISATFYSNQLIPQVYQLVDQSNYEAASIHLLETIAFACMNIITYRQLLIRYDAFCWTFSVMPHILDFQPKSRKQQQTRSKHDDDDDDDVSMFDLGGVEELEKKIVLGMQWQLEHNATSYINYNNSIREGGGDGNDFVVGTSNAAAAATSASTKGGESYDIWGKKTITPTSKVEEFTLQVQSFVYLLAQTDNSQDKTAMSRVVFNDKLLALGMRMTQYLLVGLQSGEWIVA